MVYLLDLDAAVLVACCLRRHPLVLEALVLCQIVLLLGLRVHRILRSRFIFILFEIRHVLLFIEFFWVFVGGHESAAALVLALLLVDGLSAHHENLVD